MKKIYYTLTLSIVFAIGFCSSNFLHKIHAQNATPSYTCTTDAGGTSTIGQCVQFVVEVSSARLGGGIWVYQINSSPVDLTTMDETLVQSGAGSTQYFMPSSTTNTFTLGVTRP